MKDYKLIAKQDEIKERLVRENTIKEFEGFGGSKIRCLPKRRFYFENCFGKTIRISYNQALYFMKDYEAAVNFITFCVRKR